MIRKGDNRSGPWHVLVERAGRYEISLRRWPEEAAVPLASAAPPYKGKLANYPAGKALSIAKARLKIAAINETKAALSGDTVVFRATLPAGPTTLQTWFLMMPPARNSAGPITSTARECRELASVPCPAPEGSGKQDGPYLLKCMNSKSSSWMTYPFGSWRTR